MKIVAILQARMGSTRLPGKVMLPLAGRPMLEHIYRRVSRATKLDRVIVAIPKGSWNDMRDAYIPFNDFFLFDGDENDLVARYLACATLHQADLIVRVPCDNPCVEPRFIDMAIQDYLDNPYIYYSNTTVWMMDKNMNVDGLGAEVCSISRLKWLDHVTSMDFPAYREHPHKLFESRGIIKNHAADLRLDVNTQSDYDFIADIYDHCYPQNNQFTIHDILAYLETKKVPA